MRSSISLSCRLPKARKTYERTLASLCILASLFGQRDGNDVLLEEESRLLNRFLSLLGVGYFDLHLLIELHALARAGTKNKIAGDYLHYMIL